MTSMAHSRPLIAISLSFIISFRPFGMLYFTNITVSTSVAGLKTVKCMPCMMCIFEVVPCLPASGEAGEQ